MSISEINSAAHLLSEALTLHRTGNLDRAEAAYRQLLAADANHAQALGMLGMLRLQRGDAEQGMSLLRASLQVKPDQPDVLNNLGLALQMLKLYDAALTSYNQAISLNPNYLNAHFNRGNLLHDMMRYDDALISFRKVIALNPRHADAHVNLGNALKELGQHEAALASFDTAADLMPLRADIQYNRGLAAQDLQRPDQALAHYNKAIAIAPGFYLALHNRAVVLQSLKRLEEALADYDRAIALKPDYQEALYNRGVVLKELKRYLEALASYDQAIALSPLHAEAHNRRALALQELQRYGEAETAYLRALHLNPEYLDAYINLGLLFIELGRMDEAEKNFQTAIQIDPEYLRPYLALSILNKYSAEDAQFKRLEAFYADRATLARNDQSDLDFAMGRALENMGRYDEAFSAYEEGNRLHHLAHPYDEKSAVESQEWAQEFFTRELFEKYAQAARALPATTDERVPIFIVGMPRSGTTLLEQVLASHPALFAAGELETLDVLIRKVQALPHNDEDWTTSLSFLRRMGEEYLEQVWRLAPDARFITDKMPSNWRYLGFIKLMLPQAKIIHAMRNPMDTCFSCYAQLFKESHWYSYDMDTLGRYYQRYKTMMERWHQVLPPGQILDVRYEDTVADLEGQARRLLDYLGLPWDPACLDFYRHKRAITTASHTQVRKPLYSTSVARWKRFEQHLGPLLEIVGTDY